MSQVKELIDQVRENGFKLVILWFATSKNGHPTYAPEYIKTEPETYQVAVGSNGAWVHLCHRTVWKP